MTGTGSIIHGHRVAATEPPVLVDPRLLLPRYEKATELVGIGEARDELIKMLMVEKQEQVISIVGFGGLGKTALATVVFQSLRAQFDCSAFVAVSQTPDIERLFSSLLYQLGRRDDSARGSDAIDELRGLLHDKRYLVVVDDVWDTTVWKIIRCALPPGGGHHGRQGCKIIATTRIFKVAQEVGRVHEMKPLGLHSSRVLLYTRVFGNRNKDRCPDEKLAEVSDRILMKCAGVPLAIITVASLLASKGRSKLDWYEVYNSISTGTEHSSADVENMRKVLSLSYYDLPSHLRTCLLYLSVFPEDYEIDKSRLIWMWIAEGFIIGEHAGGCSTGLFEVGESYFNELINRSMIQPRYETNNDMRVSSCRVHDMVLDLICSLSSEENFVTISNDVMSMSRASAASSSRKVLRRLSLQSCNKAGDGAHGVGGASMQQVRSVVAFSSAATLMPALSRFKVVRVLCLENCDLSRGYSLAGIGRLVHLRFLGLRSTKIVLLPDEIGDLRFLQMLDISGNAIPSLPPTVAQLKQLKCLHIGEVNAAMSNSIGRLTSLQELSGLRVKDSHAMGDLGHLTQLRELDIVYSSEQEHALVMCLQKLQNLRNLSVSFHALRGTLDGWVGPRSLRSFHVRGYWLLRLPGWMSCSRVENLSFLEIDVEELHPEDLETLGSLPALRSLHMYLEETTTRPRDAAAVAVSRVEFVIGDGWFPCLEHVKLRGHYERVVFRRGAMPRLTSLDLDVYGEVCSTWAGIPDLGFENLPLLLDVRVGLRRCRRDGDPCEERATTALRNMAEMHPNHPSILVASYQY